jgi:hypothetical protein
MFGERAQYAGARPPPLLLPGSPVLSNERSPHLVLWLPRLDDLSASRRTRRIFPKKGRPMKNRNPVDELEGLDAYDRLLVLDMDDNCPIYADAMRINDRPVEDVDGEITDSAA